MSLINELLQRPPSLTNASRYTALNGVAYLVVGTLLVVWPGVTQTLSTIQPCRTRRRAHSRHRSDDCCDRWLTYSAVVGRTPPVAASVIDRFAFAPLCSCSSVSRCILCRRNVRVLDASLAIGAGTLGRTNVRCSLVPAAITGRPFMH
jgi:hypothetical protein